VYRRETKICCDICHAEITFDFYDMCNYPDLDLLCENAGWIHAHIPNPTTISKSAASHVSHICPECIRRVGYIHAFGLTEIALKKFDPQTYNSTCELIWRMGDEYLSFGELVDLTHSKEED